MIKKLPLIIYTFGHYAADFASVYIILQTLGFTVSGGICILLYNFCAFALQMPIGIVASRTGCYKAYAIMGCIVIAAAAFTYPAPIVCALLCGIGNALYHVGGGGEVLHASDKVTDAGIFVASGALGLFFGRLVSTDRYSAAVVIGILGVTVILIGTLTKSTYSEYTLKADKRGIIATACLFAVTVLRSYVSLSLAPDLSGALWAAAGVGGVALGKAAGGILADRTSLKTAACISLTAAAVLYIFSDNEICAVLALLFFNMTMPITLHALTRIYSGAKTFAFGLLTFALFIGFLPEYLHVSPSMPTVQAVAACGISIILLARGLKDA